MNGEKRRFPRTDDRDLLYLVKIREKYPPPEYNPHTDGGYNPAHLIIDSHLSCSKKQMRKLCRKHALDDSGPKRKLMKRMYLHWRAKRLWLETEAEYFGYGPGYENTRIPDCSCGYLKVADWNAIQNQKEDRREMARKYRREMRIRRFPREPIWRYPRLPKGEVQRFPR